MDEREGIGESHRIVGRHQIEVECILTAEGQRTVAGTADAEIDRTVRGLGATAAVADNRLSQRFRLARLEAWQKSYSLIRLPEYLRSHPYFLEITTPFLVIFYRKNAAKVNYLHIILSL